MQKFPLKIYEEQRSHAAGRRVTLYAEHAIQALLGSIALISAVVAPRRFQTVGTCKELTAEVIAGHLRCQFKIRY